MSHFGLIDVNVMGVLSAHPKKNQKKPVATPKSVKLALVLATIRNWKLFFLFFLFLLVFWLRLWPTFEIGNWYLDFFLGFLDFLGFFGFFGI